MVYRRAIALGGLVAFPVVFQLGACEKYNTCENTLTCDRHASGGEPGDGDSGGTAGGGEGGDTPHPCDDCADSTRACKDETECVECTAQDTSACTGETDLCDDESNLCVQCLSNDDCEGDTPLCNASGECEACTDEPSCGDLGNHCLSSGACVECTVETDDRSEDTDDCGTGVCNPETLECEMGLTQMGKEVCEPCIADNECPLDHNCVPMEFKDDPREGGYCLRLLAAGCGDDDNPFRSSTPMRASLSGTMPAVYCSINEAFTTCEAYRHLEDNVSCIVAADCGAADLDDGLCETVTGAANKCTYECDGDNTECRASGRASTCGGDAQGDANTYCGGM